MRNKAFPIGSFLSLGKQRLAISLSGCFSFSSVLLHANREQGLSGHISVVALIFLLHVDLILAMFGDKVDAELPVESTFVDSS